MVDGFARTHDINYMNALKDLKSGRVDKKGFKNKIHSADNVFINKIKNTKTDSPLTSGLARRLMQMKKGAEIAGMPTSIFSGAGNPVRTALTKPSTPVDKLKSIAMKLAKSKNKRPINMSGGFIQAIAVPVVTSLVSSLAGSALSSLIGKLRGKGMKGGAIPKSLPAKRKLAVSLLQKYPIEKQKSLIQSVTQ
jgi:hypothetical protein